MSIENKYRVHEVAKDFKRSTKEVMEILTQYASAPKNHMQALTDEELSIIFAYLTFHNQVESMESIFSCSSARRLLPPWKALRRCWPRPWNFCLPADIWVVFPAARFSRRSSYFSRFTAPPVRVSTIFFWGTRLTGRWGCCWAGLGAG